MSPGSLLVLIVSGSPLPALAAAPATPSVSGPAPIAAAAGLPAAAPSATLPATAIAGATSASGSGPAGEGPPPPEALVGIGGDREVSLSWLPSPSPGILGYNLYRSTASGVFGTVPVNRSLITGTEFLDNEENSTSAPDNGTTFYFVVRAVDTQGRLSALSEEARARPEGTPVISEVPRVGWEGFGESQLSVSGRKVVSLGFTVRLPKESPGTSQLSGPQPQRLNLEQQLQVRLNGTVGKKITVDVDYDDTAPDQTKQKISVVYAGEPTETIERAEFGDIRLQLSDTEFTGYDKQLFGVRVQARPLEKLQVTGIATQTQGINASESFVGSSQVQHQTLYDSNWTANKFFHIAAPWSVTLHGGIKPGSEQIYLDDGVLSDNTANTVPIGSFWFDRLYQGVDYAINYTTGTLNFNRPVSNQAAIAVSFTYADGTPVWFGDTETMSLATASQLDPCLVYRLRSNWDIMATSWSDTRPDAMLIFDGPHTGQGDAHMISNWYQVGQTNIVPPAFDPNFSIQVQDVNGNQQTGIITPILDSDFFDFGILKIVGAAGRGGHAPQVLDPASAQAQVLAKCLTTRPAFAPPVCAGGSPTPSSSVYLDPPPTEQPFAWSPSNDFYNLCQNGNAYLYGTSTTHQHLYSIAMTFLTRISTYRLKNINIVRGSERITLEGRPLTRDVDYFIDYDFGQITFLRPEQIQFDSHIQIDYEYLPFGGQFQSFLYGVRAQYAVNDRASVGATYLSNNDQNPQDAPSPSGTPRNTTVMGADGRAFFSRSQLSSFARFLPGFDEVTVPMEMEVRGEIARSDINPNTFDQSGVNEHGVAMIDSMEGVDNSVSAGVDAASWFPSAVPAEFPGNPVINPVAYSNQPYRTEQLAWRAVQDGHIAGVVSRSLEIAYQGLNNGGGAGDWDGIRYVLSTNGLDLTSYQYLEMWIKGDGSNNLVNVSLGLLDEDTSGNACSTCTPRTEDVNGDFTLNAGEDNGIYHDGSAYWGAAGGFWNGWGGPGGGVINTEDMNGNGRMDTTDAYFEYRVRMDWTGWQLIKIPILPTQTIVPGTEAPFSHTPGAPNYASGATHDFTFYVTSTPPNLSLVRALRLWVYNDGGHANASSGDMEFETVELTGNRWLLRTTPGASLFTDSSKFNVSAVSEESNAAYTPNLNFYRIQATGDEQREQSLEFDYNLFSTDGSNYYATRAYPTPTNLNDYRYLRFDLYKANVLNSGEVLYFRAGGDESNYFQWAVPLDAIQPNQSWQTVTIDLADTRNRTQVGTAAYSGIKQYSFGVVRYDPPRYNVVETIWIDNLRLTDPLHKTGLARQANVRLSTPLGSTFIVDPNAEILPANAGVILDSTYREVDNDFRLIDQPETIQNNQHQTSYNTVAQVRQIPKLPMTANWQRTRAYVESQHRDDPLYFFAPDRANDNYNLAVTSQHLNPVALDVTAARNVETDHYLTAMAGADFTHVTWSVSPRMRAPLDGNLLYVPLGRGGEISGVARYSKDSVDYVPNPVLRNLVNRSTDTLDEQYDYRSLYKPFGWLKKVPVLGTLLGGYSNAPRAGYRSTRARGQVGAIQVVNLQNPVAITNRGRFQPVTQEVTAGDENRIEGIKGITPTVTYNVDVRNDYTVLNMSTLSSLSNNLDVRPGDWWKFLRDQSANLSYTVQTNAQYYDVFTTDPVSGARTVQDPKTREVKPVDKWWITRKDDALTTSNTYSQTYVAGGQVQLLSTFRFTPNYNYQESLSLQQLLRSRSTSTNAGSGFSLLKGQLVQSVFRYTPLFWMNFAGLDGNYSFRKAITFDFNDQPTNTTEAHQGNASMTFSPVKNMSGNIALAVDRALSRTVPDVRTTTQSVRPSLNLGYSKAAGFDIPLIWWKLRLKNLFTVRHTFQMNFIKNTVENQPTGNRTAREIQDVTEAEYEMLRGVSLRLRGQYDQVQDFTQPTNDFQAYSFFGTFIFNF